MVHIWTMEIKSRVEGITSGYIYMAYLLRSMPLGVNMDMGKGYDDNDRLR